MDKEKGKAIPILKTELSKFGEVYIPGSSIRGAFRSSYVEIIKSLEHFNEYKYVINDNYLFEFNKNDNFIKSRIHIEDAYLISENNKSEYEQIYLCTSMKEGRNNPLSIHAIEKGRKFKTRIKVDNIDYKEIFCLLQIISLSFIDEFRIGSNKSRGFGRVKLNIKDIILEIKDDKEEFLSKKIKKYFELDETMSLKVSDGYLKEVYRLNKNYIDFNFSPENLENLKKNDFLKHIQEKGGINND